jgi:hypothetical protein
MRDSESASIPLSLRPRKKIQQFRFIRGFEGLSKGSQRKWG